MERNNIKRYNGRKVLVTTGDKTDEFYKEEKINIVRSFEDFKNDVENSYYSSIELLEDNLELYRCEKFKTSDLAKLVDIRNQIARRCHYNTYLTKNEIINLLENDYIICIENVKEISLEEAKTL